MVEYVLTLSAVHMMEEVSFICKPGCFDYVFPFDYHCKDVNYDRCKFMILSTLIFLLLPVT